jgi:sirohydrochlorin cobaltochelatase
MSGHRGLILFAHGSRDPNWRVPIEAVARRVALQSQDLSVTCAYLELDQPDLPTAAARLVDAGVVSLAVVPMFLGVGKHAREDLPLLMDQIRREHPGVPVQLAPALGEQPAILDFLAEAAGQFALKP